MADAATAHTTLAASSMWIRCDRPAGLEVVEPRQPVGAVEAGKPQRHARSLGMTSQERFRFHEHAASLAARVRGCFLGDDAATFIAPHARGTRQNHPRRASQGIEQTGQAVDMDVTG